MSDSGAHASVFDGLKVELVCASLGRRILAWSVDMGVIYFVGYVVFLLLCIVFGVGAGIFGILDKVSGGIEGLDIAGLLFLALAILVAILALGSLLHGYFIYFEYAHGTTPGKKLFGLKVVSEDGRRITKGQCTMREMLRWVDCFMVLPGIIACLMSAKKQRIGDMVAGTIVTYSARQERAQQMLYLPAEHFDYLKQVLKPSDLTPDAYAGFLPLAFRCFVQGDRTAEAQLKQVWLSAVMRQIPGLHDYNASEEISLRFFAELCHQSEVQNNAGKKRAKS